MRSYQNIIYNINCLIITNFADDLFYVPMGSYNRAKIFICCLHLYASVFLFVHFYKKIK